MTDAEFEAAKLDAIGVEVELRNAEGGGLTSAQIARQLGLKSSSAIRSYRIRGQLFAWEKSHRDLRYPAWQIYRGKPLPGLADVLQIFEEKGLPPLSIISFFVCPSEDLNGKTPLKLLRAHRVAEVVEHARRLGDIGS